MGHNVEIDCIICGGPICLPQARFDYLERTKKMFYCSAGHEQQFIGEKITPELVARLRAQVATLQNRWDESSTEAWEFREMVRSCPLGCGWRPHGATQRQDSLRAALAGHLVEAHGARMGTSLAIEERATA